MKQDGGFKAEIRQRLEPYWQAMPDILKYQIASKVLMSIWLFLLGSLSQMLLKSAGRVAVTSGDFKFLFTSWQGILFLLVGLVSLYICVTLDLNTKIVISRNLLLEGKASIRESFGEAFRAIGRLLSIRGFSVVIYVALIAPLVGLGLSISKTRGLYIPPFIGEVIQSSPLYMAGVCFLELLFLSVGIANLYILHGIILDRLPAKEAGDQAKKLMRENWKDYLKQNVLYILVMAVLIGLTALVFFLLPLAIVDWLPLPGGPARVLTIIFFTIGVLLSLGVDLLVTPMYILKMTQLFYSYKTGEKVFYQKREKREHPHAAAEIVLACVLIAALVVVMDIGFDTFFPQESDVKIIAHRAGGKEGPENTLAGFEAAWVAGAYGSETDIQRTKDGRYILNHDGNFKRVAGEDRKPEEMTLKEIRSLSVDGEPVPTLEEAMDFCKGRLVLYLELKGKTADRKMADDVVKLIRRYGMEKECVVISLKYDLIDYIEKTCPQIRTGFLLFASYGDTALLNCDEIGMEEESATVSAVGTLHDMGKKALVWTVNKEDAQRNFLCSDADALITDNVRQCAELRESFKQRSDFRRMLDRIRQLLG